MSESSGPAPAEFIVLVDEEGRPLGRAEKWSSHHQNTPLHLAFSCYVFDSRGRTLITQRAAHKKVWPGVWSNTACGHPAPGESIEDAIRRRLDYELGMSATDLRVALPSYRYRAPAFGGVVENEFCPVYLARADTDPKPNPEEVAAFEWVGWERFLRAADADDAGTYSWWCKDQLAQLRTCAALGSYTAPQPD
ncbi:MAG TPA: isopentenyl-diphosphate Delta-isomerase [Actinomycetota bacterium]|nr:isopentenyl-diphosphate Delta-isomerase [Actinomycetota bacterium]